MVTRTWAMSIFRMVLSELGGWLRAIALDSMHNRRVVYPREKDRGTVVIEPRKTRKGGVGIWGSREGGGTSKAVKKEGRKKTRGEKERERGSRNTEISKAINNESIKHDNWYEEKEFEVLQKRTKKRESERGREGERGRERKGRRRKEHREREWSSSSREGKRELIVTTYWYIPRATIVCAE